MTALIALAVFIVVLVVSSVGLEDLHRRTGHLPRAPFGADTEGDADLRRVQQDLRAQRH